MTVRLQPQPVHGVYSAGVGQHSKKEDCSSCGGSGKQKIGNNGTTSVVNCVACHGSGKV